MISTGKYLVNNSPVINASLLNIPVRGTLGIVLVLKKQGKIKSARKIIQNLVEHGMYLSPDIIDKSLERIGE